MIRIALADDHTLFRKGMIALLQSQPDFEVVADCDNGKQLLDSLSEHPADVVLLDLEMPEMDGMATTKALAASLPEVMVIILSMHNDEQFIVHLMESGAKGYLLKNTDPDEIEQAIRSVHETGYYFSDLVSRTMLQGLVHKHDMFPKFNNQDALSEREIEVLKLICAERTTTEIGEELFISPRTVEGHRNNILQKTGARNTAGMVVYAIKNQLVPLDPNT